MRVGFKDLSNVTDEVTARRAVVGRISIAFKIGALATCGRAIERVSPLRLKRLRAAGTKSRLGTKSFDLFVPKIAFALSGVLCLALTLVRLALFRLYLVVPRLAGIAVE